MSNTVNRQDAIEACESIRRSAIIEDGEQLVRKSAVKYVLEKLPSAEPERFTHRKEKVIQMMIKIIAICILSIMLGILIGMHI